jgi:hypothetical protein
MDSVCLESRCAASARDGEAVTPSRPCYLSDADIARRLLISRHEWPFVRTQFETEGMPAKDAITKKRYWPAVVAWLDARHGIGAAFSDPFRKRGEEHWDEGRTGPQDEKARGRQHSGMVGSLKLFPAHERLQSTDGLAGRRARRKVGRGVPVLPSAAHGMAQAEGADSAAGRTDNRNRD